MDNDKYQGGPRTFQEELRGRCREWWSGYEESIAQETRVKYDWPEILYDFVRDIALHSFKNGKAAGMRTSEGSRGVRRGPIQPARVNGTALANGKLRRVQPEVELTGEVVAEETA